MNRTNELNNILLYIEQTLVLEAPTSEVSIDYLIASLLDNKKCHAHFIMDMCLMSSNLDELCKIYDDFIRENLNLKL